MHAGSRATTHSMLNAASRRIAPYTLHGMELYSTYCLGSLENTQLRETSTILAQQTGLIPASQALLTFLCVRSHTYWLALQGDGSSITVEPGLIGGEINGLLARHKAKGGHDIQYKIGPDPSSIDSCMIGGMVANNSSGMCCGVSQNVRILTTCQQVSFGGCIHLMLPLLASFLLSILRFWPCPVMNNTGQSHDRGALRSFSHFGSVPAL